MLNSKTTNKASKSNRLPSKCTCTNTRRASRAITKFYDASMEASGLKITQFSILRNVMLSGPLSTSKLSQILNLDRTTLVRNLKSLESLNYIESAGSNDSRERPIIITEKGRNAVDSAIPYWEQAQESIKVRIGSAKLEDFIATLMEIESMAS